MSLLGKSYIALLQLLKEKKISTKEVHEYFVKRTKKYNKEINAFLTLSEESGEEGEMPMVYKDNFNTKGIRTTVSSKVLDSYVSPYDATVVERLKESKTYVFGKTNMDAWAHGASTETSDYGATKNPWDTTRVPGGSSGGSGAAVAAYLSSSAIGSDTGGSIRCPASWCGVVGLKPTYGRVSRYGVIAMGSSFDCPGPMSWYVEDCAFLLSKIAGFDPFDATSSKMNVPEYEKSLSRKNKLTIGIAKSFFNGVSKDVTEGISKATKILEKLGHTVKKIKLLDPKYVLSVYTILQRAEVSSNLSRYDGVRYGNDRTYFGNEAKRRVMLGAYTLSHGYYDAYYLKAMKVRRLIRQDFEKAFDPPAGGVDVLICPTSPTLPFKLGEKVNDPLQMYLSDIFVVSQNLAGVPSLNVPCGFIEGLPVGMQIVGPHFSEKLLYQVGHAYEQETKWYERTPKL